MNLIDPSFGEPALLLKRGDGVDSWIKHRASTTIKKHRSFFTGG